MKYNDKQYTGASDGSQHPAQEWLNEKFQLGLAFPNLPYFIETDGYSITEHTAIPIYIASKYGPQLLGETSEDKANVDMIYNILQDAKKAITQPCYTGSKTRAELATLCQEKAEIFQPYHEYFQFLVGDYVSHVDFYWFELIQLMNCITEGAILKNNQWLNDYNNRILDLTGVRDAAQSIENLTFNMKFAQINN